MRQNIGKKSVKLLCKLVEPIAYHFDKKVLIPAF
jgi:hypothetical protein